MRKIVLLAAAVVAMASCTQKIEPVLSGSNDKLISFETPVVGKTTKAIINETAYPEKGHFGVFAVHHTNDYNTPEN